MSSIQSKSTKAYSPKDRIRLLKELFKTVPANLYYSATVLVLFIGLGLLVNIPTDKLSAELDNLSRTRGAGLKAGSAIQESQRAQRIMSQRYNSKITYYRRPKRDYVSDTVTIEYHKLMEVPPPKHIPLQMFFNRYYYKVNFFFRSAL